MLLRQILFGVLAAAVAWVSPAPVRAQAIDCNRLAAQIAALAQGGGSAGRYAVAAQRQRAELARVGAYARSLGCDRPGFFMFGPPRPPQCEGLNAQISRMQANLAGLEQAAFGGDGGRAALQARFDAYCRGADGYAVSRDFLDRMFDTNRQDRLGEEGAPDVPFLRRSEEGDDLGGPSRGGGQALCVRTCDGGWFPMHVSTARRELAEVQNLCSALCPGTEAKLFTRVPGADLKTAVALDGMTYADMPNAFKFEKQFDKTCSCKPPDKSWVEALADAERLLGDAHPGDLVVTPEKAEELSRPGANPGAPPKRKFDAGAIAKSLGVKLPPETAAAMERQRKTSEEAIAADAAAAARAPAIGADSSGISQGEQDRAVLGRGEGAKRDALAPDGSRRNVRVIPPRF